MAEVIGKSTVFSSIISHKCSNGSNNQSLSIRCSVPMRNLNDFGGLRVSVDQNLGFRSHGNMSPQAVGTKMGLSFAKAQKWWEKGLQPNMKEITSAQDLVDSLLNAGDKLVVVDFFSPGCGGCRALHPKICQLAEMNPDVQFLQINYEELKSMCYSLGVHVLPFFRFYRGAEGRVCSFSCTNATIKKFKDALAKYGPERCTLGQPKGLEEKELIALAANKDLSFTYTPKPVEEEALPAPALQGADTRSTEGAVPLSSKTKLPYPPETVKTTVETEDKTLATAGGRF